VWAADIMKTDLVTARYDDTLMDVARRMVDERVRHVLVFGDNGGVVSVRDVLEAMVAERSSVPVASPSSARTHRSPPILRP